MRLSLPFQIIKLSGMNPMRELLYHPSLRDFPDYLAFQAVIERKGGVEEAIKQAKQAQAANDNRKPVGTIEQQQGEPVRRMGMRAHLNNAWADLMGQEKPHK